VPQGVVAHFGLDRDDAELGEVSAGDELVADTPGGSRSSSDSGVTRGLRERALVTPGVVHAMRATAYGPAAVVCRLGDLG